MRQSLRSCRRPARHPSVDDVDARPPTPFSPLHNAMPPPRTSIEVRHAEEERPKEQVRQQQGALQTCADAQRRRGAVPVRARRRTRLGHRQRRCGRHQRHVEEASVHTPETENACGGPTDDRGKGAADEVPQKECGKEEEVGGSGSTSTMSKTHKMWRPYEARPERKQSIHSVESMLAAADPTRCGETTPNVGDSKRAAPSTVRNEQVAIHTRFEQA